MLTDANMNLVQLSNTVPDKATAFTFLQQRGILHNPRVCTCGRAMLLELRDKGDRWRCNVRGCRSEISARKDTWLEGSKVPYRKVIQFLYCWSKELTSIEFSKTELGISSKSTVDWNNFIREVCAMVLLANRPVIGGPGLVVEVDESLFSRQKNHQGRMLPQQWVFGGVCRQTRESFMYTVPDRSGRTLLPIIQQSIAPGTTIMSDMWAAYGGIQAMGFAHLQVNHTYNFVDPQTGAHTQNIENSWKNAKMRNKRHHGTHRTMIDSYLCDWMWRQRYRNVNLFDQIMRDISIHFPPA